MRPIALRNERGGSRSELPTVHLLRAIMTSAVQLPHVPLWEGSNRSASVITHLPTASMATHPYSTTYKLK